MEIVRERDKVCQFWIHLIRWAMSNGFFEPDVLERRDGAEMVARARQAFGHPTPECFGDLVGHEPLKRSHGADTTNPDEVLLLCVGHNGYVEDFPIARKLLGL
jgi:hypothetical protein